MTEIEHAPVMLKEAMDCLQVRSGGTYLDATLGGGGHAEEILKRSSPDGILWGVDRDDEALSRAVARLMPYGNRARPLKGNFSDLDRLLPVGTMLDGVLADLGVSSFQLMDPARGFSFQREGPLDMRMNRNEPETALGYLRKAMPAELERRLAEVGEGRFAKRLAPCLIEGARVWTTTSELAAAVARLVPRRGKTHQATRVFLALRMAVNREMEGLADFLERIPALLKPGARAVVITFHSTEDRLVKRFSGESWEAGMRRVTKSPLIPTWEERRKNPRSRSAKLRVF